MSGASESEKIRAARQLEASLRPLFVRYLETSQPEGLRFVQTNVGSFAYFGYERQEVVNELGPLDITGGVPTDSVLMAVSSVPTSSQKVALLHDLTHRIARALGAGPEALVTQVDPTATNRRSETTAGRDQHVAAERRIINPTDYKNITEPYIITIRWTPGR